MDLLDQARRLNLSSGADAPNGVVSRRIWWVARLAPTFLAFGEEIHDIRRMGLPAQPCSERFHALLINARQCLLPVLSDIGNRQRGLVPHPGRRNEVSVTFGKISLQQGIGILDILEKRDQF